MATIDSLQIEIQSNATNASVGISALADSLGKLKNNGSVGVAVKNIKNLSSALKNFTPVASNAQKIRSLADAVEKLSNAGSLTKTINQLHKLASAVKSFDGVNTGGVGAKFKDIADASSHLSGIKASGFSSMVNGLAKIKNVTQSLDPKTISDFADKVSQLSTLLTPLSTKMTSIAAGFRVINSNARTASTGVSNLGKKVNVTTLNMATMITTIRGIVAALRPMITLLVNSISDAMEWDGISQRFGRGFGTHAEETYAWLKRLNEELDINIQQFMQYSSTYATMLTGFGLASKDASKMALGYMELTYDVWAGYNDIYKSLDDAAMAIRSAIAGEVEPIRKAGFTITEATLQQTAANHGLAISLETASEAQKSYLRYLTLVDQAHAQNLVGTYAKELNTAEGQMRTFRQQLKSLAQTFGSLFLPILVKVMPWLQAMVDLLGEAIIAVANFFGIEIQKVDFGGFSDGGLGDIADAADGATGSLGNTSGAIDDTTKALKELKNATVGIDELNVISPPSNSGANSDDPTGGWGDGSGSSGILGNIESLWDESIFEGIQSKVEEIKEKIKSMLPVIGGIATAFAAWKVAKLLTDLDDVIKKLGNLEPIIKGLAKGLAIAGITIAVGKLVWDFTGAYLDSGSLGDLAKIIGTTILGAAIAGWLAGPLGAGLVIATSGVISLTRLIVELEKGNVDISDPQAIITAILGSLETILGGALIIDGLRGGKWTKAIGSALFGGLKTAITSVSWSGIASSIGSAISGALTTVASALGLSVGAFLAIVAAIVGAIVLAIVDYDFTDVGHTLGEALGKAIRFAVEIPTTIGEAIGEAFASAISWLRETFDLDTIGELLMFMFNPVYMLGKITPKLGELFVDIGEWFVEKVENFKGNINEFFSGFFDGLFDGLGLDTEWAEEFGKIFDIEYTDILGVIIQPITLGRELIEAICAGIKNGNLVESIKKKWEEVKSWWKGKGALDIVQVGVSLVKKGWTTVTSWIGSIPGVSQAVKLVKDGWSTVKGWIGSIPTISQMVSLAKQGWSSIKSWIGSIPVLSQGIKLLKNGWSSIKSWIGSISALSQKISLSKNGWSTVKSWIGTIPTILAKIGLQKNGWSSIKSWLGNLDFKLNFKLPKIKVNWGEKTVAGFTIKYPTGFSTYAKGGFPNIGEMFIAREAGPEMVGRIGNRTTVANNDQIVAGISQGVYEAVISAMKASGSASGEQSVKVYLDGKEITSSVERRQHERGASIMGTQVYAY